MDTISQLDAVRPSTLVGMVHHLGYPVGDNRIIPGLNGGGHATRLGARTQQLTKPQPNTDSTTEVLTHGYCQKLRSSHDRLPNRRA